jgi:glycosyltransferase involved in cell wall biosynthesis
MMVAMAGRILQVVTDTDRRGAQVFATDLDWALTRRGRCVRTVALAEGAIGGLSLPVLGRRRLSWQTLAALRREVAGHSIAIAHGSSTLPACAAATIATSVPFVYRQISDSRFWAPGGLRRLRTTVWLHRASRVVALSRGSAETLRTHLGVRGDALRVIPNAVPSERFSPRSDEQEAQRKAFGLDPTAPVVGVVGALVPEKGPDLAIEAIAALPGVQLLVVGDGPQRAGLEAQARRVAPERIVFAGHVADVRRVYAALDLIALPSRGGDSMPAVLIEAGLMEVPAVSTPVQAIPEIVRPGETGELVPVGDVAALAAAIRTILSSPARGTALGRAARERCLQHFSIDRVAGDWDELVTDVLEHRVT